MRSFIFTSLLFLLVLCPLLSQENGNYLNKPIVDIQFENLGSVSRNELSGLMRPYFGEPYTDDLSWEIQSKLYALDYFDLIIPTIRESSEGGVILVFDVQEKPLVGAVVFVGNKNIRKGELIDTILIQKGDIMNPGVLHIDELALIDLYIEKGFVDATVVSETELDEARNQVEITFTISEGTQTKISEILFVGNDKHISDAALQKIMETKAQSLFQKGLFIETKLQEDIKAIERHYRDQGFIDAKVIDVDKKINFDDKDGINKISITITIEEGESWKFSGIEFVGNTLYSTDELMELVTFKPGDTFSLSTFQTDYQSITDRYYENGYIFNSFTYTEERNEDTREVSFTVDIVEKERAYIENIIIRGNTKTKSYVIQRELPLEEGDVFSKEKIYKGTLNLYNLRYFDAVEPHPYPGSQDGLMDLVIDVSEGKTTNLAFGITFSGGGEFPLAGQLSWTDTNFLGRGQVVGATLNVSPTTQNISMRFTEPKLLGRRWQGGMELSYRHQLRSSINQDKDFNGVPDPYLTWEDFIQVNAVVPTDFQMAYDTHYISTGFNTGYTWVTNLGRLGISTGLQFVWNYIVYDPKIYTPHNSLIRDNLDTWKYSDSIFLKLKWDTRDLQYDPTKGFLLSQTITFAGILQSLSNRNYIKSVSRFNWNLLLFDVPVGKKDGRFKSVFSINTAFNAIFDKPWLTPVGDIAETNGFFIDGMFIGRGWPPNNGEYYRYLWDSTMQVKFPIIPSILSFDIFLDAVGAWQNKTGETSAFDNWTGNDWRFSLGAGLRFANPQFPIGIYLVKRFQWKDDVFTWFPDDEGSETYEFAGSGLDLVIAFDLDIY